MRTNELTKLRSFFCPSLLISSDTMVSERTNSDTLTKNKNEFEQKNYSYHLGFRQVCCRSSHGINPRLMPATLICSLLYVSSTTLPSGRIVTSRVLNFANLIATLGLLPRADSGMTKTSGLHRNRWRFGKSFKRPTATCS